MTEDGFGESNEVLGRLNGGLIDLVYGLDSDDPELGNFIPPSGPKLGVGSVGSENLPNGGNCIPPCGAIEGENKGLP